jgi:hypothetical protein
MKGMHIFGNDHKHRTAHCRGFYCIVAYGLSDRQPQFGNGVL